MFVERKKEGGRGEEGRKRKACYFQVWGIQPVSLRFMLLSHCRTPFGLTKKKVFRDSQTRGQWLVSCDGLSAQDGPRTTLLTAESFGGWPLQGQAGVVALWPAGSERRGQEARQDRLFPAYRELQGERTHCSGLRPAGPSPTRWGMCHQRPGWGPLPRPGDLVAPLISTRNSGPACFPGTLPVTVARTHSQGLRRLCDLGLVHVSRLSGPQPQVLYLQNRENRTSLAGHCVYEEGSENILFYHQLL